MRRWLTAVHRWLGLATALFLLVAGLTGAIIAWDHELDAIVAPEMYQGSTGRIRSALDLADQVEAEHPEVLVTHLPLGVQPGHAVSMFVVPKQGDLPYDQLAVDPVTGEVRAQRQWGEIALRRDAMLPFLYKLHYSLHLPGALGTWVMGLVAVAWTVDSFVSLYLAFPSSAVWRRSFAFRLRSGFPRALFDLHRSSGVWTWGLLLLLAITAVSMNLGVQVVRPIIGLVSPLTPDPYAGHTASGPPRISRADAVRLAVLDARLRGWDAPPGAVYYAPEAGIYGVGFFEPGYDHGDAGLGNPWLYFDADGAPVGAEIPGAGSAGDLFLAVQFPLHSGRIVGTPGRIAITVLGLAVSGLSATGVLLWVRKRFRRRGAARDPAR